MEVLVKMPAVLVKIAVMMMAPGSVPAPPGERVQWVAGEWTSEYR